MHVEVRGIGSPGAVITGNCEPPTGDAGNSSERAVLTLNLGVISSFPVWLLLVIFLGNKGQKVCGCSIYNHLQTVLIIVHRCLTIRWDKPAVLWAIPLRGWRQDGSLQL